MRNIKTSMRFVRNSALLLAAATGLSCLTACSETDITPDNGNNGDDNFLVEKLKVTTGSNPSLARTFRNSHQIGTRAPFDVPQHPGMPTSAPSSFDYVLDDVFAGNEWGLYKTYEDNTEEIDPSKIEGVVEKEIWGEKKFVLSGVPVKVPAGKYKSLPCSFNLILQCKNPYWSKTIVVENPKYYLEGAVEVGGFGGDGPMQIHILSGASLTATCEFEPQNVVYLYDEGQLLRAGKTENQIYIKNTLISAAAFGTDNDDIQISGKCYTYGKIHGKTVTTLNSGELYAGCSVTAVESVNLTNNSVISAGYVSAPDVVLDSNTQIELRDGGYLYAPNTLKLQNIGTLFVTGEEIDGKYAPAMIETKTLLANDINLQGTFQNMGIKYEKKAGSEEGEYFIFNQNMQVACPNENNLEYQVVDGDPNSCGPKLVVDPNDNDGDEEKEDPTNPGGNDNPGNDPKPGEDPKVPTLENIGTVAPTGDHTHPISATCIFTNGKDAYLSWHTQGTNFHGCIEYLTVDNGTVTLNSYLETAPDNADYGAIDFNHVIFDNGKLFVAGDHPKKGGILGWIHCNGGKFVTGEADLNLKELYNGEGGSGNCIIRNGNYYQVASVKGFETYNLNAFDGTIGGKAVARLAAYDFDPQGESSTGRSTGKHIATDGKNVVMLTLINRDNSKNTAKASIKVFSASDIKFENCLASYIVDDAVLSPVDGKDVIAIEGDDIWVCLGKGGVQHLKVAGSSISKVAEFVLADLTKEDLKSWSLTTKEAAASCANGLAVGKDGYVYVAHGGAGLVVLDKEDMSFVTRSRYNGGNSANYVALHEDGYIYVAYGKSNVQVFGWKK